MSDLMVLNLGNDVALPFDQNLAFELTKNMTAGLGGNFQKTARISMGNSGDWELVDENGEIHDLGREVNIVIVDQREFVSRIHYAKSFDEMKATGEFEAPDCQSYNGEEPDSTIEKPYSDKCRTCKVTEISGQKCGYYRRLVGVLAYEDGTFSDPFVFEPKSVSLFDKTVVKERWGNLGWILNVLKSNTRNGEPMPIPTQAVVINCIPMPKMEVATIKFGLAAKANGGYWVLTKEQMDEIVALKNSKQVQDMLKPFNAASDNPSSAGRIPVKEIDVPALNSPKEEAPAETKKAPPAKKPAPKPTPKPTPKKTVVLGMEHPDVKNNPDYDYDELMEWAKDADEADVTAWLKEVFPQALEPVEVETPEEAPVETKKAPPAKKAPVRKPATKSVEKTANEPSNENVVDSAGSQVSPELAQQAEKMAEELNDFADFDD